MQNKKICLIKHPLIEHYAGILRNEKTDAQTFRWALKNLTKLIVFHVTQNLNTREVKIKTPLETTRVQQLSNSVILLPILRAGWGMLQPFEEIIPHTKIGQIGYFRDEKKFKSKKYYFKLPKINPNDIILLLDPMLATGGTIIAALKELKKITTNKICIVSLFAAPEGIEAIENAFPNVCLYLAQIDNKLNNQKYILPGLGDAGDRFFNTE